MSPQLLLVPLLNLAHQMRFRRTLKGMSEDLKQQMQLASSLMHSHAFSLQMLHLEVALDKRERTNGEQERQHARGAKHPFPTVKYG